MTCRDEHIGRSAQRTEVLVVEDSARVRQAITAMLDREPGVGIREAGSLADARALLSGVDLAILDLGLPDGDGTQLIPDLKALNPDAKAIVFTASPAQADADRALDQGAAAVLNKLTDFDHLLDTVKRLQAPTRS